MKRTSSLFFIGCLLVPLCFLSWAANFNSLKIPTLTVTVSDFTLDYAPAGRTVTIRPNTGGATQTDTSDTDGLVTFNVVTPGLYTLTIADVGVSPLTILVPNQTGTVQAKNIVVSDWTPPSAATTISPTDNLRGWSLIPTNVLSSSGGDTVWTNADGTIRLIDPVENGIDIIVDQATGGSEFSEINFEAWPDFASNTGTNRAIITQYVDGTVGSPAAEFTVSVDSPDGQLLSILDMYISPSDSYVDLSIGSTNVIHADATAVATEVGFASSATDAAVSIDATGWTNTFGKNATVYFDGGQITFKIFNGAGTAVYTNAIAVTNATVLLQPSGKVTISGNSVSGRATPF